MVFLDYGIIGAMKLNPWASRTIYQIYPRSFKDSNNDGIGDLPGIIEKLDYLKGTPNSLGIDAVWISPIYKSPMKDFGYDVSNYCEIDPIFGNLEDFDRLVNEAHKRDIKVIMDYIPGHTSIEHPWFLESKSSHSNPKRDWYIWKDPKPDGSPPNNWLSVFGGSRWEKDKKTNQYYLHTFIKEQADLNWRNEEVKKAMLDVLRFWLKRGVDGFRIDAFEHVFKEQQFLDQPFNTSFRQGADDPFDEFQHIYTRNQPELLELIKIFTKVLSEYGNDKFFVTESYSEIPQLIKLYKAGNNSHAPFNFQFISLPWDAQVYKKHVDEFDKLVGSNYIPTYVLGNHDRHRITSRIGEKNARVAAMLLLTLRGIPTIYYGDELGMKDVFIPKDQIQDPFEKNMPGLGFGRDPERTPMQWDSSSFAGFSQNKPWLPLTEDYPKTNVKKELKDPHSILNLYKTLLTVRKASQALHAGTYTSLTLNNPSVFAYLRESGSEKILVVLNFSTEKQLVSFPFAQARPMASTLIKQYPALMDISHYKLLPHEGIIVSL